MANEDFYKVIRKDVEIIWPRLDQTYRYNSQAKKTEPCAPSVQGAAWSLAFLLSEDAAKELATELKVHYQSCVARNSKLPSFEKVFGAKKQTDKDGNLTGMVQFTAERKAIANNGNPNTPPAVVGRDGKELADKAIWSGSRGHVRVYAVPTQDPDGIGGIKLLLNAVQITDAVYGGDNLEDDFGPFEPEANFGETDAFENHQPKQAPEPAKTPEPATAGNGYGF